MAEFRTIGLTSIKVGAIAGDGGMGTTLAALGVTYQDTAVLEQGEPEKTEFYSEESDDPIEVEVKAGITTVKWSITDFTPTILASILGGTATGTAPNDKWEAPDAAASIEKSVEILTKKGMYIRIPRAKIVAKININLSKKNIGLVDIVATVLKPTKAATASFNVARV
jgi:hypothetical protein